MFLHLCYRKALVDVPIQHRFYQVNRGFGHDPWYAQLVVEDLIDAVEGVFFVDESIEQDSESPYVLLFAAVGFALEDFWGCVIYGQS